MSRFKSIYWRIIADRSEEKKIVQLIRAAGANPNCKILEIGCGLGRNLLALHQVGLSPVGVDVNENTVEQVKSRGFKCFKPGDEAINNVTWDVLLMSHLIEHFDFSGMVKIVDSYLQVRWPGFVRQPEG